MSWKTRFGRTLGAWQSNFCGGIGFVFLNIDCKVERNLPQGQQSIGQPAEFVLGIPEFAASYICNLWSMCLFLRQYRQAKRRSSYRILLKSTSFG